MISYSWHYKKPLVDRMYKYLIENGHDVWKDDEGRGPRSTRSQTFNHHRSVDP